MKIRAFFFHIYSNKNLTALEKWRMWQIEQKFYVKYGNTDLANEKCLEMKHEIEKTFPRLKSENWEFMDPNYIQEKLQEDSNIELKTIPDDAKLFHPKISHPVKAIGEFTKNNKTYFLAKPLTTTNHNLENLLSDTKIGSEIPKEKCDEFFNNNDKLKKTQLLSSNMIEIEDNKIKRGNGSWFHGENGDLSLEWEYDLSNNKTQWSSSVCISCEKDETYNYLMVGNNRFSSNQSNIINSNVKLKKNHEVLDIKNKEYDNIETDDIRFLKLDKEQNNNDYLLSNKTEIE